MPLSDDIVATGSSDGMVRIVSILPNKLSESIPPSSSSFYSSSACSLGDQTRTLTRSSFPSKSVGVITHHNDFPIERLALSHDKAILGSASHDECVKLTDVRDIFDDSDDEDDDEDASGDGADSDVEMGGGGGAAAASAGLDEDSDEDMAEEGAGSESEKEEEEEEEPEEEVVVKKGREKRKEKRPANREEEERNARGAFFDDM